jgi:transcription antitermination protein NusB
MRRRTRARELALQFLYTYEMRGEDAMADLGPFVEHHTKTGDADSVEDQSVGQREEVANYADDIIRGVHDNLVDLNTWIEHIARNWRLDRMAYLDRNVLRIAMYELLFQPDVPFKVVINEAIDMAKRYSTSQSGSFVNGILDRAAGLIKDARKEATGSGIPMPPNAAPKVDTAAEEESDATEGASFSSMVPPHTRRDDDDEGAPTGPPSDDAFPTPRPTRKRVKRLPTRRYQRPEDY